MGRRARPSRATDHGMGIPVAHRAHLFEHFAPAQQSTHRSGLGRYLCRRICELHGGSLAAEFPDEGGTRFVVRLPIQGE